MEVLCARDEVAPVADPSTDVHVEDRREDRRGDERQRDDRAGRDRKALADATEPP